jgi:hypothetical protein
MLSLVLYPVDVWSWLYSMSIFQMAGELSCLLCKLPLACSGGDLTDLRDHLRGQHEVVR